ncbi:MAG: MmcQ/YjbR family DNA-binding protein [Gaiellaceae bacterium]
MLHGMATLRDLDRLALALPEAEKPVEEGRPSYVVRDKWFCFHRRPRPDAVAADGTRLEDVRVFRVDGADAKELSLADPRGVFFTTPHWNGFPAVLVRIPDLDRLERDELRDAVVDAWLTRAPKRLARAWLAEHGED